MNVIFHSSDWIQQENKTFSSIKPSNFSYIHGVSSTSADIYRLNLIQTLRKTVVLKIIDCVCSTDNA